MARIIIASILLCLGATAHADEKTYPGSACTPEDWLQVTGSNPLLSVTWINGEVAVGVANPMEPWFTCPIVRDEMAWVSPKTVSVWVFDAHPSKHVTCQLRWKFYKSSGAEVSGVAPMGSTGLAFTGRAKLLAGTGMGAAAFPQDTAWWIRCQLHESVTGNAQINTYWVEEY